MNPPAVPAASRTKVDFRNARRPFQCDASRKKPCVGMQQISIGSPNRPNPKETAHLRRPTTQIQFLVLVVSLALVIGYSFCHGSDLRIIFRLDLSDTGLLIIINIFANFVAAYRLHLTLSWSGLKHTQFVSLLRIFFASRFANFYVTQGANAYRAVKLKKDYAFSYSGSLGVMAVITCFDVASVLFVTGLLVLGATGFKSLAGLLLLGAAAGVLSPLLALPPLVRRLGPAGASAEAGWRGWAGGRIRVMAEVVGRCTKDLRTMAFLAGMTITVYLALLGATAVCLAAFGRDVSMFDAALLTSVLVLSRAVNIVPGNLGVSELLTGVSAGVLMDEAMYGVMISAIFRVIDFAVVGSAFLAFGLERVIKKTHDDEPQGP